MTKIYFPHLATGGIIGLVTGQKQNKIKAGNVTKPTLLAAGATHENNIFPTVLKTSLSLDIVDLQHAG